MDSCPLNNNGKSIDGFIFLVLEDFAHIDNINLSGDLGSLVFVNNQDVFGRGELHNENIKVSSFQTNFVNVVRVFS